jgi:hypothetical protein
MNWDRPWKWVERIGAVVTAICALAGTYYAAGTYYGWDKVPRAVAAGGNPASQIPWFAAALLTAAIATLIMSSAMIVIRRRSEKTKAALLSASPSGAALDYSDDPEAEATDKQAYKEILAFALDRVMPACEAQVELQKAILSQVSGNPVIGALAYMGVEHSDRTKEFWNHYTELTAGLLASPGPIIRFETIIEHIAALESGNYRELSEQMNEFVVLFSLNVRTNATLRPIWLKWVEAHNALVDAFDSIKRDPRFGKLLRPVRPSRWGDCIQTDSLEQTIDIRFEPQPPYESSEITNERGLSTVRIGLKASGKTFSNCRVYIEKIAPQPPLPGGMPILLADDAPMLRQDDPETHIRIAQHWDHVGKYRFSAPLPPFDVHLTYIDDQPSRLIEIKITAWSDAGEFLKTATFKIWVDDARKIHLQQQ